MSSQGMVECIGIAKTRDEGVVMAMKSFYPTKEINTENVYSFIEKKKFSVEHNDNKTEIYDDPTRRASYDCAFVIEKRSLPSD